MSRLGLSRLLLAALLLVLTACQANVRVELDVAEDGTGTVSAQALLDAEADATMGGFAEQLRVADLDRSGWEIVSVQADDGSVTMTATKEVDSPDRWQSTLDELAGPGVFNDVRVDVVDDQQQVSFDVDLRDGWQLFADEDVTAAFDGEDFGAPLDVLTGGRSIDEIIGVDVVVSVRNQNDGLPTTASFNPRFDDDDVTRVGAIATTEDSLAVLLRWIAIALFSLFVLATVLAITGIVLQRRADRLRPAPTPTTIASRIPGADTTDPAAATAPVPTTRATEAVRLVVLEPLAVLYEQPHAFDRILLAFVREHGGTARADTIADGYTSLLRGATDSAAFWDLCGIELGGDEADEQYVERRSLRRGASKFFDEMQRRRIPIAAVTNDAAAWSSRTRERDRLSVVWPWLISGEVGTETANVGMFEVLRRESGVAHSHCLYVDADLASLDVAAELGMKTALFDTGDLDLPDVIGHPVVTDLSELFGSNDT